MRYEYYCKWCGRVQFRDLKPERIAEIERNGERFGCEDCNAFEVDGGYSYCHIHFAWYDKEDPCCPQCWMARGV